MTRLCSRKKNPPCYRGVPADVSETLLALRNKRTTKFFLDFKRETYLKKKTCQRDDSPTSDVETGIPTRERKLEEDVESGVPSYDHNISPDSRRPSSMQNHSPLARRWRRTSWSIVRISSSTVFLGITKERRMTDRLEKQLRMKMRRPSWLNAPCPK